MRIICGQNAAVARARRDAPSRRDGHRFAPVMRSLPTQTGADPILHQPAPVQIDVNPVPRAVGVARLAAKRRDARSVVSRYRSSGALKLLFANRAPQLEAIVINTAGGLTGGDRIELNAQVEDGAHLVLTTQAAERAYCAASGEARMSARIDVGPGGQLSWLPQELILYDGACLNRRLTIALAQDARLLMVEPVIFGRHAMGEVLQRCRFRDRIEVMRDGAPLYLDGVDLSGDLCVRLRRAAIAGGAGAMASLLYVAPDAEAQLAPLRGGLPATAGASLLAPDVLSVRLVAADGFDLRATLLPVLDRLSRNTLPASWRL